MKINKLQNGTRLNRNQYEITKYIGSGGFGITYLAKHLGYYKHTGFGVEYEKYATPITVVIKELFYETYCDRDNATGLVTVTNASKKEEFQKLVKNQLEEGKIVRLLDHPNIVRTRDIFNENDTAYMVMNYIDSVDLEDVLFKEKYLSRDRALHYIEQVLDAVAYFHNHPQKKILHLDLKPSNILLDKKDDKPVIIDFGSALSYDPEKNEVTSRTSQLITGMTRNYAPTEQNDLTNLKKFEASFDTYAIGATLYHLLTGQAPPESGKVSSGFTQLQKPSEINPDNAISDYLDEVVLKAISPRYPNRFHSANTFRELLKKEELYNTQIRKIEALIAQENYEEAEKIIKDVKERFIETQQTDEMLTWVINKKKEQEKLNVYNSFISKGKRFYDDKEYKQAEKYFNYAQEEIPEKEEAGIWIQKSREQRLKIAEEEQQKGTEILVAEFTQCLQLKNYEKAKLILSELEKQAYPPYKMTELREQWASAQDTSISQTEDDALVAEIPTVERPKKGGTVKVDAVKKEETTIEEAKPQAPKGKTVKIATPSSPKEEDENQEETEKSFWAKYGLVLGGVAILLVGVAIWGIGFGGTDTAELVRPTVVEDSTAIDNNATEVALPQTAQSQEENVSEVATQAEEPQTEESETSQEAEIPAWKTNFDKTFTQIRNAESSRSPESSKTKYQTLLNTLPAAATAEKRQINARIAEMNRKIQKEKDRIAAAEEAERQERERQERERQAEKERQQEATNLAKYNEHLDWCKNMMKANGKDWCIKTSSCSSLVKDRLRKALKVYPNGTEARNLLNEFN